MLFPCAVLCLALQKDESGRHPDTSDKDGMKRAERDKEEFTESVISCFTHKKRVQHVGG